MEEKEEYIHLTQLRKSNLISFQWLYNRYFKQVYHFCLSLSKSPLDAEEISADVFVAIWKKRATLNPALPLGPLLFKITRDLSWNYLKRVASRKRLQERLLQHYAASKSQNGESDIIFREYLDIMDQVLQRLSPQQQKVFRLRYLKGKDLSQIASELNISKNTVRVHLTRSKRLVLDYLKLDSVRD